MMGVIWSCWWITWKLGTWRDIDDFMIRGYSGILELHRLGIPPQLLVEEKTPSWGAGRQESSSSEISSHASMFSSSFVLLQISVPEIIPVDSSLLSQKASRVPIILSERPGQC